MAKKLDRIGTLLPSSFVPSSNNRTGLSHWKGKPVLALEDWIQICGQLSSRLEYSPDDFDQALTYMELPYYRYEFEGKKRKLKAKRQSDGWLNDEVGYGSICHDLRGNLVDELKKMDICSVSIKILKKIKNQMPDIGKKLKDS